MHKRSKVERADIEVAEAVAPIRHSLSVRMLGQLSELADQPPLNMICAATFALGLLTGNRRLASAGGRMLAAQLLSTQVKSAIKHRIDRTRPRVADDGGAYAMKRGHSHASADNSFPSGHTAGAVAVARAFVRDYPEHRAMAYGAAVAVAAIQLPRCQHYPSDLAAGAAVGLASEATVHGVERLLGSEQATSPASVRAERSRSTFLATKVGTSFDFAQDGRTCCSRTSAN